MNLNPSTQINLFEHKEIFKQLATCEQNAAMRFYGMADVFARYQQPYETLIVGCEKADKES